jgi:D-3-phosphoglycerate dehydrogenase / 2-oxoglutarate reductase
VTPVAITPRSFRQVQGEHLELLAANGIPARFPEPERPLGEREMVALVGGCRALIVGVDPVTDAVLAAGPLRLVVKYGSGLDNVDLEAAQRRGVRVVATPGTNSPSVAELAVAMMFALARHLVPHQRAMVDGSRTRRLGIELAGRQLGIIGYGNVGRRVAALGRCLGLGVVAHDPFVAVEDGSLVGWHEVLASDIVSVHVPYDRTTHHLIDRAALSAMRQGSLLINTSRPPIVDEAALADALDAGSLGGAAFDDLGEDAAIMGRLLASDRFLATPHCGAATVEAARRTAVATVRVVLEHRDLWQDSGVGADMTGRGP